MTSFKATDFPIAGTDITRAWAGMKLPPLNATALLEAQRKNAVALTAANQTAFDGLTRLAERQGELIRSTVGILLAATSLEEPAARQTDAARQIYASAVARFRELSDIAMRTNLAAADILNARVVEAFDDVKALIAAPGPVAAGDESRVPAPVELQVTPATTDVEAEPAVIEPEPPSSPAAPVTTSPTRAPSKPRRRPPARS